MDFVTFGTNILWAILALVMMALAVVLICSDLQKFRSLSLIMYSLVNRQKDFEDYSDLLLGGIYLLIVIFKIGIFLLLSYLMIWFWPY